MDGHPNRRRASTTLETGKSEMRIRTPMSSRAQTLFTAVLNRSATARELSMAAAVIHFGFGATVGAIYGVVADKTDRRTSGPELGTTLWLAADEIAMPLLGLSQSTLRRPLEMHLQSFVAHLVYGVVTERVRRIVRSQTLPQPCHMATVA